MGIPQYFYVITKQFKQILSSSPGKAVAHLFLDYNGIIHQATRAVLATGATKDTEIFAGIWAYTERVVGLVQPSKQVYIMVDGVAPKAKMVQQRKRRYLSTLLKKEDGAVSWDTNAISPGTAFMTKLHTFLKEKAAGKGWFLSGADEPGEGEHKMFDKMSGVADGETIFVYGLDADLIMLSLLSGRRNIYLMREMQVGSDFQYLEVDRLSEGILGAFPGLDINSYIVLCFLLGNDFLPNLASLNLRGGGIEMLVDALKTVRGASGLESNNLVVNGAINIDCLGRVLQEVARKEDDRIWQLNEEYLKRRAPEQTQHYYPLLPENKAPLAQEIYSCQSAGAWRRLYYKHLFPGSQPGDSKIVVDACSLYFQGLSWTYAYYTRVAKDDDWFYPYGYAPTAQDLSNYVGSLYLPSHETNHHPTPSAISNASIFVNNRVQLLAILPLASNALLPATCRKFQTDVKYGATHLYPSEFKLQTYLKGALHECNPILPALDFGLLESLVN